MTGEQDSQQAVQGDAKPATNWVSRSIGTGNLGHAGTPNPYRLRPDLCPNEGHPGVTYHPQQNRTWCLCGAVIRDGDTVTWPKADGEGGPLREELQP